MEDEIPFIAFFEIFGNNEQILSLQRKLFKSRSCFARSLRNQQYGSYDNWVREILLQADETLNERI
jgi:hypothetical protein